MSALPVVTLDELKQHLRVEYDVDDDLIQSYGLAAVEYAEQICDREIIKRSDPRAVCESIDEVPSSIKTWVKLYVAVSMRDAPLQRVPTLKIGIMTTYLTLGSYTTELESIYERKPSGNRCFESQDHIQGGENRQE